MKEINCQPYLERILQEILFINIHKFGRFQTKLRKNHSKYLTSIVSRRKRYLIIIYEIHFMPDVPVS